MENFLSTFFETSNCFCFRCREISDCRSFLLDYDSSECHQLETNADDNRDLLITSNTRVAYFEKVCLRAPSCEKAWIFERAVGYLLGKGSIIIII